VALVALTLIPASGGAACTPTTSPAIAVPANGATYYIATQSGPYIYQETNNIAGLQRGHPSDPVDDTCAGAIRADKLIF
jgi:hypothetical protein